MKAKVINLDNKSAGDIELPDAIFGLPKRLDILQRCVEWQRARKQAGTHKTKTVSEISGTTKKPHAQKGSGRARSGSLRSPQNRGGAKIFGPVVRDHGYSLPKKVRQLALKTALSVKQAEGNLIVLDSATVKDAKTKVLAAQFKTMGLASALIIDGAVDESFAKAARNIKHINVLPTMGANVYDILRHKQLVLTKSAIAQLTERLGEEHAA
jgi:large subunit ribosomal protein L4